MHSSTLTHTPCVQFFWLIMYIQVLSCVSPACGYINLSWLLHNVSSSLNPSYRLSILSGITKSTPNRSSYLCAFFSKTRSTQAVGQSSIVSQNVAPFAHFGTASPADGMNMVSSSGNRKSESGKSFFFSFCGNNLMAERIIKHFIVGYRHYQQLELKISLFSFRSFWNEQFQLYK